MKFKLFSVLALTAMLSLTGCNNQPSESVSPSDSVSQQITPSESVTPKSSPLEIYVLEMAGIYGDSIYLKQGDVDILIDAGWDTDGAYVRDFVDEYCQDDVLDLLVVTHPHGDHVGGMATALTNVETITNIIDYGTFATAPSSSENGLAAYETLKKDYIENMKKLFVAIFFSIFNFTETRRVQP